MNVIFMVHAKTQMPMKNAGGGGGGGGQEGKKKKGDRKFKMIQQFNEVFAR